MSKKAAVVVALSGLSLVDLVWAIESGRASPLIAAVGFVVVAALVGTRSDFRAGAIVGVAGVAVHLFELVFHGLLGVRFLEAVLFSLNLCLSLVVAVLSWRLLRDRSAAERQRKQGGSAQAT